MKKFLLAFIIIAVMAVLSAVGYKSWDQLFVKNANGNPVSRKMTA
jgi:Tfp pilus assembly protein PilE